MSAKALLLVSVIVVGGSISACDATKPTTTVKNAANSQTPSITAPSQPPVDNAPRITLADAKKAFDDGTAIFIDTRSDTTYKQEHITGSINIPTGSLDANISKLNKGKKLIAYCS